MKISEVQRKTFTKENKKTIVVTAKISLKAKTFLEEKDIVFNQLVNKTIEDMMDEAKQLEIKGVKK